MRSAAPLSILLIILFIPGFAQETAELNTAQEFRMKPLKVALELRFGSTTQHLINIRSLCAGNLPVLSLLNLNIQRMANYGTCSMIPLQPERVNLIVIFL